MIVHYEYVHEPEVGMAEFSWQSTNCIGPVSLPEADCTHTVRNNQAVLPLASSIRLDN